MLKYILKVFVGGTAMSIANQSADAQKGPEHRQLKVTAVSKASFGSVTGTRALPNGRIFILDGTSGRVSLLNSDLSLFRIVADSGADATITTNARGVGLLPWRGDSTVIVDLRTNSGTICDQNGKGGRTIALATAGDMVSLVTPLMGQASLDELGRLVFRKPVQPSRPSAASAITSVAYPDSAPIVRLDLGTRQLDTVTFIRTYTPEVVTEVVNEHPRFTYQVNPAPMVDDWVVRSDGSIAVLRSGYRLETFDGTKAKETGKVIPFDWLRLDDTTKRRMADSAALQQSALFALGRLKIGFEGILLAVPDSSGSTFVAEAEGVVAQRAVARAPTWNFAAVSVARVADYMPAFAAGALRAGADRRTWVRIRRTQPSALGPLYDILSPDGVLVAHVSFPQGSVMLASGQGENIFIAIRERQGVRIARATLD